MEKLEGNLIKFVLGLWIVVISSTIFYYQLQDDTSLEQSMLYPISVGLGIIVSGIIMYYLIKLHGIIFKKSEREMFKQQVQQFLEYCRDKKFLGFSKKRQKFEYSSFCFLTDSTKNANEQDDYNEPENYVSVIAMMKKSKL